MNNINNNLYIYRLNKENVLVIKLLLLDILAPSIGWMFYNFLKIIKNE